eukprot:g11674.t1
MILRRPGPSRHGISGKREWEVKKNNQAVKVITIFTSYPLIAVVSTHRRKSVKRGKGYHNLHKLPLSQSSQASTTHGRKNQANGEGYYNLHKLPQALIEEKGSQAVKVFAILTSCRKHSRTKNSQTVKDFIIFTSCHKYSRTKSCQAVKQCKHSAKTTRQAFK